MADSSRPADDPASESSADPSSEESRTAPPELRPVDSFDPPASNADAEAFDYEFDSNEVGEALRTLPPETRNEAPFGIIRLDDEGSIQFYNDYESNLSGVDAEEAEGQNFFLQLAPCSNNPIFKGRFKKGVRKDELDERFTYTFTYRMRPTLVDVHMYRDAKGNNWIMIRKR